MTSSRQESRRGFLSGQTAAERTAERTSTPVELDSAGGGLDNLPADRDASYLVQFTRQAMACQFEILFNADHPPEAGEAAMEALDLLDQLEDQMSIYREQSELCGINRSAAGEPVVVESRMLDLLRLALDLWESTSGAFDMTAAPLSKVWGFHRRAGRIPTNADLRRALSRVGSQHVEVDNRRRMIRFRREGIELNLGGIGKGYALDRCAEVLIQAGMADFLLHGGKSSVLARGNRLGVASRQAGWKIGVRHPLRPASRLLEIDVADRALGTSGSATQFFHHRGRRYGHIIDPRTGDPAERVLSATVLAPSAAMADALATAFYVMGSEQAREYCVAHPELSMVVVTPGKLSGSIEIFTAGLADSQWRRLDR